MKTQRTLLTLFLVIHPITSNGVNAQERLHNTLATCLSQSRSELEEAYCNIPVSNTHLRAHET
jgi:hypothetical protein